MGSEISATRKKQDFLAKKSNRFQQMIHSIFENVLKIKGSEGIGDKNIGQSEFVKFALFVAICQNFNKKY